MLDDDNDSSIVGLIKDKLERSIKEEKIIEENLNSDIESAHLQIKALENRKIKLENENKDLEFQIAEYQAEIEAYGTANVESQEDEFSDIPEEGTFFKLYRALESQLVFQEGQLDASSVLRAQLKEKLGKLRYTEQGLKENYRREQERYDIELTREKAAKDNLQDVNAQLLTTQNSYIQVAENSQIVKEHVNAHSVDNDELEKQIQELTKQLSDYQKELNSLLQTEKDLKLSIKKKQSKAETNLQQGQNAVQAAASIKSWESERRSLISNIKLIKKQIEQEKNHSVGNQKIINDLQNRFLKIFKDKDSNCVRARAIALAELHDLQAPPTEEEVCVANAEESYLQELIRQKELLVNSLNTLESHYKNTSNSLNSEEKSSRSRMYIDLLEAEYSELQAELGQL